MRLLTPRLLVFINNPIKLGVNKIHSNAALVENCVEINNRNPRNLELMRIARKPIGFDLEKYRPNHWHKLIVNRKSRYITLEVEHFENGVVVSASSNEWPIKERLYRANDTAAYINLGRILARRCLESGIMYVTPDPAMPTSEKITLALEQIAKEGVKLSEPFKYKKPLPWDRHRPVRPWDVHE